jgi:glycosyltransferase involved in cell wall biosynthesis
MRLLLVTHRPVTGAGGSVARWRALLPRLRDAGWAVDVVSTSRDAPEEFDTFEVSRAQRRARFMKVLRGLTGPAFHAAGVTPAALPTSMAWVLGGTRRVRAQLASKEYDVVLATGPPIVAPLALRLAGGSVPAVFELRDLWAGNPAYDRRGGLLGRVESWMFGNAATVVVATAEARADLVRRHPQLEGRVVEIPNGFEPDLLDRRAESAKRARVTTILHSGTLLPSRPLAPLLKVLATSKHRDRFRLVLHGYLSPETLDELKAVGSAVEVEVLPPSTWDEAVERMQSADVCLVTQAHAAGDATAIAAKVYEYLALGKPVLCVTDGGATEHLLQRLDAGELCARLDDPSSIDRALERVADGVGQPVPSDRLRQFGRDAQAAAMDELLRRVATPAR